MTEELYARRVEVSFAGAPPAHQGPSVRMAIGVAYLEMPLFGVVLSTLFFAQVDQPFATARPECGVPHWPATAATGLTR